MAAFSVARPTPLPRAFLPAFDGAATKKLADDLATRPYRQPGGSLVQPVSRRAGPGG